MKGQHVPREGGSAGQKHLCGACGTVSASTLPHPHHAPTLCHLPCGWGWVLLDINTQAPCQPSLKPSSLHLKVSVLLASVSTFGLYLRRTMSSPKLCSSTRASLYFSCSDLSGGTPEIHPSGIYCFSDGV